MRFPWFPWLAVSALYSLSLTEGIYAQQPPSFKPDRPSVELVMASGLTAHKRKAGSESFPNPSNAMWMVSVKHGDAPVFVREPPPRFQANHSNRRQFRADAYIVNSGYRTRYPHVAVATDCPAGQ
jgi:hypothetical protein